MSLLVPDLQLGSFSDAELAAASSDAPSVAPLLAGVEEPARAAAVAEGRASLERRGYLEDGDPVEDLAAILELRSHARAVAIADLLDASGTTRSRYLYVSGPQALEESVDGDMHTFTLRPVEAAAAALADAADPTRRATDDGPLLRRRLDEEAPGWDEVETVVSSAEHVLRLFVAVRSSEEDEVGEFDATVVSGPNGVWVISGSVDPSTGEGEIGARRLGRASLEAALCSLLVGPAVERV